MGISRRMGVAISGLVFAGGAALAIASAGPAAAQTTSAPSHYWTAQSGGGSTYTYDSWTSWSWGCGCCCSCC